MTRNRRIRVSILLILSTLFFQSSGMAASPTIRLMTSPLNVTTIDIGPSAEPIMILARIRPQYEQSSWRLDGPGHLLKQDHPYKIAYIPPDSMEQLVQDARVVFAVTDEQGAVHEQSVTFALHGSQETLIPTVTPTATVPPTPTVQSQRQHMRFNQETYALAAEDVLTLLVELSGTAEGTAVLKCAAIQGTTHCHGRTVTYTAPKDVGVKDIVTVKAVDTTTQKVIDQTVMKMKIVRVAR